MVSSDTIIVLAFIGACIGGLGTSTLPALAPGSATLKTPRARTRSCASLERPRSHIPSTPPPSRLHCVL